MTIEERRLPGELSEVLLARELARAGRALRVERLDDLSGERDVLLKRRRRSPLRQA